MSIIVSGTACLLSCRERRVFYRVGNGVSFLVSGTACLLSCLVHTVLVQLYVEPGNDVNVQFV